MWHVSEIPPKGEIPHRAVICWNKVDFLNFGLWVTAAWRETTGKEVYLYDYIILYDKQEPVSEGYHWLNEIKHQRAK